MFNGIWEVGYGFQVSGLYFFGSGERWETRYGLDLRDTGRISEQRLRPNGTIVPRNGFVGKPGNIAYAPRTLQLGFRLIF